MKEVSKFTLQQRLEIYEIALKNANDDLLKRYYGEGLCTYLDRSPMVQYTDTMNIHFDSMRINFPEIYKHKPLKSKLYPYTYYCGYWWRGNQSGLLRRILVLHKAIIEVSRKIG